MSTGSPSECPRVAVVVAVRNESALIAGKLEELAAIDYPHERLHVLIVDGGSTDGTVEKLRGARPFEVILTQSHNKPSQMNVALARTTTRYVLVTDADARMQPGTLRELVSMLERDPGASVAGAPLLPVNPHPLDRWHWRISNWFRRLEVRVCGTSGLVVAPCYLFRRELLREFPADSGADDVHVAATAAVRGKRVLMARGVVKELRVPVSAAAWFRHKARRALGYLHEVVRFIPQTTAMPITVRAVFLLRAAMLFCAPVLMASAVAGLVVWAPFWFAVAVATAAAAPFFARAGQERVSRVLGALTLLAWPLWTTAVLITVLIRYPFTDASAAGSISPFDTDEAWS